jgi:hypothetical protein
MPQRPSLTSPLFGVGCILLAVVAISVDTTAQAECITQLKQEAPEGTHWSLHTDPVTNRRCWTLVESSHHEVVPPSPPPAQESTFSSQLTSFFGSFTGGAVSASPQEAPAVAPPPVSAAPRKPPAHIANTNAANTNGASTGAAGTGAISANKPERPIRPEQKGEQKEKADGHASKLEPADPAGREALFEEFLRWHESQQITGGASSPPR